MNYIEWCEQVLTKLDALSESQDYVRNHGIDVGRLEKHIWGERYDEIKSALKKDEYRYVTDDAIFDFEKLGLIEDGTNGFHKLTLLGRDAAKNLFGLWEMMCRTGNLPARHRLALETINRLSEKTDGEFARVVMVEEYEIRRELRELDESFCSLNDRDLAELLRDLKARGLIFCESGEYPDEARACYRGLVWEKKGTEIANVRAISKLLDEWETTSVEFKRELYLDTKDQKAEFVKDILGLANTQASGERLLIVGFDDKTRAYHAPPDPKKITADNIERVLAQYTAPVVEVKYETMNYGGSGDIGIIKIKRDRTKLPYKPAMSFGDKKRISEDQIFVRHGSQTQEATVSEIESLEAEALRAKAARAD